MKPAARLKVLLTALPMLTLPLASQAQVYSNGTAQTSFLVTLLLQANCTISATALDFGTQGVLAAAVQGQSTVNVTCTNTTPFNIGLDGGNVAGSTVAARLLGGAGAGNAGVTIPFQLYSNSGRTTVWGNTQATNTVGGVGTGAAVPFPVYGQIPAQATTPAPGNYQASITATVYF